MDFCDFILGILFAHALTITGSERNSNPNSFKRVE